MSEDNKNLEKENLQPEETEVVEETVDVTEEPVEVEETAEVEETEAIEVGETEAVDVSEDVLNEEAVSEEAAPQAKSKTGMIVGVVIAAVVIVIAGILIYMFSGNLFNKYNRMGYIDTSGRTIEQIADETGYELADFLATYNLPSDMPGNTYESVAYYNIPCSKIAEMYGMDFAMLKETLKFGDDITEETPWGVAEGETTVGAYIGDENLETFKEEYGLGEEVTAETKWKEVRNIVDQKAKDDRIAAEKAAKEAEKATEAPAEETEATAEAEATEAPAEETAETPAE